MAVPTRSEALALLESLSPSPRLVQHVTVVAEIAAFLAYRARERGTPVDRRLVETAALLHDVDKALPADDPLRALGHGRAGAEWLMRAGHPELARAVAAHPVMRLAEPGADDWIDSGAVEERIVAYADKRATQRLVSMEQRFERWRGKHPEYGEQLEAAFGQACRLEAVVCGLAGVDAPGVERLRWVEEARARTRTTGQGPSAPA
jgi:putative nucleotidyltransferase with HDIG domain